jgi:hypothetical protein
MKMELKLNTTQTRVEGMNRRAMLYVPGEKVQKMKKLYYIIFKKLKLL